jgi:hypothetical protein
MDKQVLHHPSGARPELREDDLLVGFQPNRPPSPPPVALQSRSVL